MTARPSRDPRSRPRRVSPMPIETSSRGQRLRAWVAALAVAATMAALAAAPASALPGNFWGVVPQHTPSTEEFQRLKRGGVDSILVGIAWASVQPTRTGPFDFSGPDRIVAAAAAGRVDVLPFLLGAPTWAVPAGVVPGTRGTLTAPRFLPVRNGRQRAGWTRFVIATIKRYGPRGTFWVENPGLPKRPLRVWQIWNEANFKYFVVWPNPAEFGKLVKLSY